MGEFNLQYGDKAKDFEITVKNQKSAVCINNSFKTLKRAGHGGPCLYSQHARKLMQEDCKLKSDLGLVRPYLKIKRAEEAAQNEGPGINVQCLKTKQNTFK